MQKFSLRSLGRSRKAATLAAVAIGAGAALTSCGPVPTSSASIAPWQPTESASFKLDRPVGGVDQDGLVIRERDSGRIVPGLLLCKNGGTDVSCSAARINAVSVLPTQAFTLGQYYRVSFAARLLDSAGRPPISGSAVFRAGPREEDQGPTPVYSWASRPASAAFGGSYTVESRAGARASADFDGSWVKVWTVTGAANGLMDIYIDHVLQRTVNTYSAKTRFGVAETVQGLSSGDHRLDIVVRGAKGTKAALGTDVTVDAIATQGGTIDTPDFEYSWGNDASDAFSAGWTSSSQTAGAVVGITFRGSAIDVATVHGPWSGNYLAYLDHRAVGEFSDSSAVFGVGTRRFTAMSDGVHLLQLVVAGTHSTAAIASVVAVDYWQLPLTQVAPSLQVGGPDDQTWDRQQYLPATVPAPPTAGPPPAADTSGVKR